jgi:hypothetical protein
MVSAVKYNAAWASIFEPIPLWLPRAVATTEKTGEVAAGYLRAAESSGDFDDAVNAFVDVDQRVHVEKTFGRLEPLPLACDQVVELAGHGLVEPSGRRSQAAGCRPRRFPVRPPGRARGSGPRRTTDDAGSLATAQPAPAPRCPSLRGALRQYLPRAEGLALCLEQYRMQVVGGPSQGRRQLIEKLG